MSIIKRKAGSEDIVKSVLEFDEVPTDGSHNLVESGAVAKAIGNLVQPLQWKGPATVEQLNDGITGIQPGWTYTLTDAGTLTDGSVKVDVGDEVAWTEDGEWFKLGGEGGVKVLHGSSNPGGTTYPDAQDVVNAVAQGKEVLIFWDSSGNLYVYRLEYMRGYSTSGDDSYIFRCLQDYNQVKFLTQVDGTYTWSSVTDNKIPYPSDIAPQYSDANTYAVGDYCTHAGLLYVCNTAIETEEAWTPAHWTQRDVGTDIVALKSAIGSVKNGGVLTDGASVTVPNNALSTLSTAQATLTLNVNVSSDEVPNFAVEVSPSADCTLTVTKTVGNTTTTLSPSVAGGNSLTTGKLYQVTCVGSCWTLAEFTVPTP